MITFAQALTDAQHQLKNNIDVSKNARLDAEILLMAIIGCDRAYLYTWPEKLLTDDQQIQFEHLLARRVLGEPVAYLTGKKEFWSLTLEVNASTLIPRPETELLVETALHRLPANDCKIVDLGTGTGAIAIALAHERPQWRVLACDCQDEIIALAKRNVSDLGIKNINLYVSHWFEQLVDRDFDLVISNPPYIAEDDQHLDQGDVRFEPRTALVSGLDGLADIAVIAHQALAYLKTGGWLMLEHGYSQGNSVRQVLSKTGYNEIETLRDMSGHQRVTVGRKGNG